MSLPYKEEKNSDKSRSGRERGKINMLHILHIPSIFIDCVIGVGQGGKGKGDFWVVSLRFLLGEFPP